MQTTKKSIPVRRGAGQLRIEDWSMAINLPEELSERLAHLPITNPR
jgi:hypothetical protein